MANCTQGRYFFGFFGIDLLETTAGFFPLPDLSTAPFPEESDPETAFPVALATVFVGAGRADGFAG